MNHWIDSHCHLHYEPIISNIAKTLEDCVKVDIMHLLCVSTDMGDYDKIAGFIEHEIVSQSVGIHPLSAKKYSIDEIANYLEKHIRGTKVRALGETGLDNFRNPLDDMQIESFRLHLKYGEESGLPIIMHLRGDTEVEKLAMQLISASHARGVGHCFGQSWEMAEFLISRGWFISFAGNITYKSAQSLRDIAAQVPIKNVLIETDAPFLAPEGHRGQPSSPVHVLDVAKKIGDLKGVSMQTFQNEVYQNFLRFLG